MALHQVGNMDISIEPCGLFIDSEKYFIGVTPDGSQYVIHKEHDTKQRNMTKKVTKFTKTKNAVISPLNKTRYYIFKDRYILLDKPTAHFH